MSNKNNDIEMILAIIVVVIIIILGLAAAGLFGVDGYTGTLFVFGTMLIFGIFFVIAYFLLKEFELELELILLGFPFTLSLEWLIFKSTIMEFYIKDEPFVHLWYDHWYVTLLIFLLINLIIIPIIYFFRNR